MRDRASFYQTDLTRDLLRWWRETGSYKRHFPIFPRYLFDLVHRTHSGLWLLADLFQCHPRSLSAFLWEEGCSHVSSMWSISLSGDFLQGFVRNTTVLGQPSTAKPKGWLLIIGSRCQNALHSAHCSMLIPIFLVRHYSCNHLIRLFEWLIECIKIRSSGTVQYTIFDWSYMIEDPISRTSRTINYSIDP